jgi:hypothetical protein
MKSVDQIQQNFITPTNHKKNWGAIFVGIFEIGEEHNKIRLENKGRGSKIVINRGS